jgi:hypothetical protein
MKITKKNYCERNLKLIINENYKFDNWQKILLLKKIIFLKLNF